MTEDSVDIDALERLAAAATPGPWEVQNSCSWSRIGQAHPHRYRDGNVLRPTNHPVDRHPDLTGDNLTPDLAYIAACHPQAIQSLIQRVREAEGKREPITVDIGPAMAAFQADPALAGEFSRLVLGDMVSDQLNAAEQRIAELTGLLREARDVFFTFYNAVGIEQYERGPGEKPLLKDGLRDKAHHAANAMLHRIDTALGGDNG